MITTVTLNPALDKCIYVNELYPNDANRITKIEVDAGGKGINAARVLEELGSETLALGFLGGQTGSFIEHVLKNEGIPTDFVHVEADTRTNVCVQEASGAPPTTFNEPGDTATNEEFDELFGKVKDAAGRSCMVIFGGSLPPGAPKDTYRTLVEIVKEAGAKAVLDSDGEPMVQGMQAIPYMIKPNKDEVQRLVGVKIETIKDAMQALNLLAQTGVKLVVISMGSQGAIAGLDGGIWHAVPPKVKVVSTIGSGDSMVAGIAHILCNDGSMEDALRYGTAAGAATAMTDGTAICSRQQVLDLLEKVRLITY